MDPERAAEEASGKLCLIAGLSVCPTGQLVARLSVQRQKLKQRIQMRKQFGRRFRSQPTGPTLFAFSLSLTWVLPVYWSARSPVMQYIYCISISVAVCPYIILLHAPLSRSAWNPCPGVAWHYTKRRQSRSPPPWGCAGMQLQSIRPDIWRAGGRHNGGRR